MEPTGCVRRAGAAATAWRAAGRSRDPGPQDRVDGHFPHRRRRRAPPAGGCLGASPAKREVMSLLGLFVTCPLFVMKNRYRQTCMRAV